MSTTSGTGQQPSLNPNLSVIALLGAQAGGAPGDPKRNSFTADEVEIALEAPVDPNVHLKTFISLPRGEPVELEEAYATWLTMPAGLQARGGLLRADFGRTNPLHTHALPFLDPPLPNSLIFGEEGLRAPGVELSWLPPLPWYSKVSLEVLSRQPTEEGFALFPGGTPRHPLFVGRMENLFDLDEDTTLQLGVSGATSEIGGEEVLRANALGLDVTLKHAPLDDPFRELTWETEALFGHQDVTGPRPATTEGRDFAGWSSFLKYRFQRHWAAGIRYGESDLPEDPAVRRRRLSALLEWTPSEWNQLRFQYSRRHLGPGVDFDELGVQWNLVVGPHGTHRY